MIEVTQADRDIARSIEWVNTAIDNHEAIALAFAEYRIAAKKAVMDRLRDLPDCAANNLVTLTGHRFEHIDAIANKLADELEALT